MYFSFTSLYSITFGFGKTGFNQEDTRRESNVKCIMHITTAFQQRFVIAAKKEKENNKLCKEIITNLLLLRHINLMNKAIFKTCMVMSTKITIFSTCTVIAI